MVVTEGEPVVPVWPETEGHKLLVLLNLRKYVAAVARHAGGTRTVQGAAYGSSEK
jgi:hypothetical protein